MSNWLWTSPGRRSSTNPRRVSSSFTAAHGAGANRKVHVPQILDFAQRGYVAVTVSYRLIPVVRFPGQVEDVKCAIRYLRANAEKHKLDPGKIGAVGFSAGGHLVMMLGVMDKV